MLQESKKTTNIVTVAKVGVVCFMIVGGFALFDGQNLSPYVGPKGFSGGEKVYQGKGMVPFFLADGAGGSLI